MSNKLPSMTDTEYAKLCRGIPDFDGRYEKIYKAYHDPKNTGAYKTSWPTVVNSQKPTGMDPAKFLQLVNYHKKKLADIERMRPTDTRAMIISKNGHPYGAGHAPKASDENPSSLLF